MFGVDVLPKLSIIIPCFNCEKNILYLLNVLKENSSPFIEIVLVNDGSTDNTKKIISEFYQIYKNKYFNINIYHTMNAGAAKARQYGLSKSNGKYIFFIDSDDTLIENFADIILNVLDSSNFDVLYFNSLIVKNKLTCCEFKYKVKFNEEKIFNNPYEFLYHQLKNNMWTAAVWTFIFRREIFDSSEAYFTPRKAHEDHMFTMMILAQCSNIKVINQLIYIQNITDGSLTNSSKDWKYIEERYRAYIEIKEKFGNQMSKKILYEYKLWSIKSFLELLIKPKLNLLKSLKHLNFYYIILNNLKVIFKLFFKHLTG